MNETVMSLCHHGVIGMHWGIRRYQPYGHGGYDPEHTKGRYVGKIAKAGVSSGAIGGAVKAKFGLAKKNVKSGMSDAKMSIKKAIVTTKQKVDDAAKSETAKKAKETAKKVAKVVAIVSVVTVGVALAANSEPGKKFIRQTFQKGATLYDKLNTIDTGYSKEVHDKLAKAAREKNEKLNEAINARRDLHNKLLAKGTKSITEKEKSGVYKLKKTLDSTESEFHDWYEELTDNDKKALDAYDRVINKLSAETAKQSRELTDYLDKTTAAYNTKRTQKVRLKTLETRERLSKLSKSMKEKVVKPGEEEQYQRQIERMAEEGIKKLKEAQEKKIADLLEQDISEDIEFIKRYLRDAA